MPCLKPRWQVLNSPIPERWKAELTLVLVIYQDGLVVRRQLLIKIQGLFDKYVYKMMPFH